MPHNAAVMWTRRRTSLHSNRVAFQDGFVVANSRLDPASGESLSSPLWVCDRRMTSTIKGFAGATAHTNRQQALDRN
jgi:hypothetical protein